MHSIRATLFIATVYSWIYLFFFRFILHTRWAKQICFHSQPEDIFPWDVTLTIALLSAGSCCMTCLMRNFFRSTLGSSPHCEMWIGTGQKVQKINWLECTKLTPQLKSQSAKCELNGVKWNKKYVAWCGSNFSLELYGKLAVFPFYWHQLCVREFQFEYQRLTYENMANRIHGRHWERTFGVWISACSNLCNSLILSANIAVHFLSSASDSTRQNIYRQMNCSIKYGY